MKTILTLILFLVIGFLGSRGWVKRVRVGSPLAGLLTTGIEFFFIGVLLGPAVLNIISLDALERLKPLAYLALGWTGLLFGIQMSWPELRRVSRPVFTMIVLDAVIVMAVFAAVFFLVLRLLFRDSPRPEILESSVIFAITAALSSPTIIAVLARTLPSRGAFTRTVKVITSLNALVPLFAFGFFFIVTHQGFRGELGFAYGLTWWVFANAVGVVLGFVMVLLTVQKCPEDERLLLVIGFVLLVGGLCFFLKLSTLYTAMMVGIVAGNFSNRREQIFRQLLKMEKTMFVMFLILVGAMTSLGGSRIGWILGAYLLLRLALKSLVSRRVLISCFPDFCSAGPYCGLVFAGQGGMALAMVLDYWLAARGGLADTLATVVILAVVCNEIAGFYFTRMALAGSGDVKSAESRALGRGEA
jgi:Kef-type K+ transport system membrane component KefB